MINRFAKHYRGRWGLLYAGSAAVMLTFLIALAPTAVAASGIGSNFGNKEAGSQAGQSPEGSPGRASDTFDEFSEFDEFESEGAPEVFDPLIGYNRIMTQVNDRLYFWGLKPVAQAYGTAVPKFARQCVNRFFDNLGFPVRFVNNLLQLKLKGAGVETLRFGVNSTLGIAGFMDPAGTGLNLSPYEEDFGQTLGHYGLNGGFHLVLPVFGPSNFRDTLGRVPDGYLDPMNYMPDSYAIEGVYVLDVVNGTSLRIGQYESFRKDAMDIYILFRNAYEQNRKKEIEE